MAGRGPAFPGQRGWATFEWLDGGAFLCFHSDAPHPAPSSTWIIGRDDSSDPYTVLPYDSRTISRVWQMSFSDRDGKVWRETPSIGS